MSLRAVARGAPGTLWRRIYTVKNPGNGVDVSFAVPTARVWQLLGVAATFTASGVAGNRNPLLSLFDVDAVAWYRIGKTANVVATNVANVYWTAGITGETVAPAGDTTLPLPSPCYMLPGEKLTLTGHTDPGDHWTALRVVVLETNYGDPAYIDAKEQSIRDHLEALYDLSQ